jgi:hypothetical protein
MKIKNIGGLSADDLQREVDAGGKFVYFPYTISLLFVTLKRSSGVYLIRKGSNAGAKSIPYILVSLILGWWGIPYGPLYTIESIRDNFNGGKDVTDDVMATVAGYALFEETQRRKKTGSV